MHSALPPKLITSHWSTKTNILYERNKPFSAAGLTFVEENQFYVDPKNLELQ